MDYVIIIIIIFIKNDIPMQTSFLVLPLWKKKTINYCPLFEVIFLFLFCIMHWASYFREIHLLCGFFSIRKKQGDSGNNAAMGN